MKTVCKGDTKEKKIAITFDDGPVENYTPRILQILNAYNVKATFFCIGKNAAANNKLLQQVYLNGHTIGSHSYSHGFWFDLLSAKKMQADLQQAHDVFKKELGIDVKWFRPPYGVTTPNLKKAAGQMGYTAIGWNVRSLDTVMKNEARFFEKLKQSLQPGNIFLFHDSAAITVNVLPKFLTYAQSQGFKVVPLQNLINLHPYAD